MNLGQILLLIMFARPSRSFLATLSSVFIFHSGLGKYQALYYNQVHVSFLHEHKGRHILTHVHLRSLFLLSLHNKIQHFSLILYRIYRRDAAESKSIVSHSV